MKVTGTYEFLAEHSSFGFFPKPNLVLKDVFSQTEKGAMSVYTDSNGFRIADSCASSFSLHLPATIDFLCLGASWTWGSWIEYDQTYCAILNSIYGFTAFNGSCPSHNPYQSLLVLDYFSKSSNINHVLIDINIDYLNRIFIPNIPGPFYRPLLLWSPSGSPLPIKLHNHYFKNRSMLDTLKADYISWLARNSIYSQRYSDFDTELRDRCLKFLSRYLAMMSNKCGKLSIIDTSRVPSSHLESISAQLNLGYICAPPFSSFPDSVGSHPGPCWNQELANQITLNL